LEGIDEEVRKIPQPEFDRIQDATSASVSNDGTVSLLTNSLNGQKKGQTCQKWAVYGCQRVFYDGRE
jgi:hypothetical protein